MAGKENLVIDARGFPLATWIALGTVLGFAC